MKFLDHNDDRDDAAIEITSLIDVMFMLVLFFILTTTFDSASGFHVNLPKSSSKDIVREKEELTIVVGKDDSYAVNDKTVNQTELQNLLSQEGKSRPETLVILRADRDVSHGKVVEVMDLAKQAGLNRLAIATERLYR